jgi:predicted TIM-barrel fold metal-dependent hydrolase
MLDFRPISADSHVNEHPDAWARVQREYGERAPHIVKDPPGMGKGLYIITDGMRPMRSAFFALGHVVTKPEGHGNIDVMKDHEDFKRRVEEFNETYTYEGFPGGWNPEDRLKDMDKDGVEAELLFPSPTRFNYTQTDAKFQRSIFRSYNEWLLEMCGQAPKRLFAVPLISILDVDLAVQDIREYVRRGCKTVQIPTQILGSGYYEEQYEPLWATAADCGIPLSVHSNSSQNLQRHHVDESHEREYDPRKYILKTSNYLAAVEFVSNLIFSGVFDRYPSLKVNCVEFKVSSAASIVEHADYQVGRESTYDPGRNAFKRQPSEYMHENVYWGFEDDRAWVLTTPVYGEDNFLWGNDYPHFGSTWPYSQKLLEYQFQGIDPQVQRKLARDNINKLYNLGL